MKINNKHFPLLPILSVFILAYLFLAAKSLGKKPDIKPEWTIFIGEQSIGDSYGGNKLMPFKSGSNIGYYRPDGTIASLIPVEYKASVSANFWAVYNQDADRVAFYTPDNSKSGNFDKAGFPFFTEEGGIFLFHPGGSSFSKHNGQGDTEWVYENYVPITAFSSSAAGCSVGFADGNVVCLDTAGKIIGDFFPGGSNLQVIFGTAISQNGLYCACLSGLNSQRIVVAELGNKTKIIYHSYLEGDLREQTLVQFSSDDKYVFFNGKAGLTTVVLAQKTAFFVPFSGKILSINEFGNKDLFLVLSKNTDMYTVTVLSEGKLVKGAFSFKASSAFLHSENGSIYVGSDNRISKMALRFD